MAPTSGPGERSAGEPSPSTSPSGSVVIVTMPAETERQFTDHVGMIVFLGGWAMMFGALFFCYALLRLRAPSSLVSGLPSAHLSPLLPSVATALLLASEGLLLRLATRLRSGRAGAAAGQLGVILGLGVAFLGVQGVTWVSLGREGVRFGSGALGSLVLAIVAFHALHVVVGLVVLALMLPGSGRHKYDVRYQSRLRLAGMFWHFVGLVWLVMFASMFLA